MCECLILGEEHENTQHRINDGVDMVKLSMKGVLEDDDINQQQGNFVCFITYTYMSRTPYSPSLASSV